MMRRGSKESTFGKVSGSLSGEMSATCDHIGIFTRNAQRLESFYVTVLGFKREKKDVLPASLMKALFGVNSGCTLTRLASRNVKLELFQPTSVRPGRRLNTAQGYNHWGYHVGDREKLIRKLSRRGVNVIEAKRGDHTVYFLRDPDGNRIELRG